jgi:hypothetical protein
MRMTSGVIWRWMICTSSIEALDLRDALELVLDLALETRVVNAQAIDLLHDGLVVIEQVAGLVGEAVDLRLRLARRIVLGRADIENLVERAWPGRQMPARAGRDSEAAATSSTFFSR